MSAYVSVGNRLYIGDNLYSNLHYHTLTYSKFFIECMHTAAVAGVACGLVNNIIIFAECISEIAHLMGYSNSLQYQQRITADSR